MYINIFYSKLVGLSVGLSVWKGGQLQISMMLLSDHLFKYIFNEKIVIFKFGEVYKINKQYIYGNMCVLWKQGQKANSAFHATYFLQS